MRSASITLLRNRAQDLSLLMNFGALSTLNEEGLVWPGLKLCGISSRSLPKAFAVPSRQAMPHDMIDGKSTVAVDHVAVRFTRRRSQPPSLCWNDLDMFAGVVPPVCTALMATCSLRTPVLRALIDTVYLSIGQIVITDRLLTCTVLESLSVVMPWIQRPSVSGVLSPRMRPYLLHFLPLESAAIAYTTAFSEIPKVDHA